MFGALNPVGGGKVSQTKMLLPCFVSSSNKWQQEEGSARVPLVERF